MHGAYLCRSQRADFGLLQCATDLLYASRADVLFDAPDRQVGEKGRSSLGYPKVARQLRSVLKRFEPGRAWIPIQITRGRLGLGKDPIPEF